MLLRTQVAVQVGGKSRMELTLPKPGRASGGALPVHEPKGTVCLWFHRSSFDIFARGFFPILFNLLVEKAFILMQSVISIISAGSPMGPLAIESVPLGLCAPTSFFLKSSSNSPFLPFLPHTCEKQKHSRYRKQPPFITSLASNPKYISMLTVEMSKCSFTISPSYKVKYLMVLEVACTSLHRPRCPSRYMCMLWASWDLSFTEQVHFI